MVFVLTFTQSFSQDISFNSIHKLVEAKKYKEAIPLLNDFIKKESKHVSAHYDLAICYDGLFEEIVKEQNANVNFQKTELWQEQDYAKNLAFWKSAINKMDSAIYFYKQTSALMNIKFITLDLRYDEFYQATKNCDALSKVKCARSYLSTIIEQKENVNVKNKAMMFNVEKKYEAFKQSNTENEIKQDLENSEKEVTQNYCCNDNNIALSSFINESTLKLKIPLETWNKMYSTYKKEAQRSDFYCIEKKEANYMFASEPGVSMNYIIDCYGKLVKAEMLGE